MDVLEAIWAEEFADIFGISNNEARGILQALDDEDYE